MSIGCGNGSSKEDLEVPAGIFVRKVQNWGLPLLFLSFLSKVKGMLIKSRSELYGGECQAQQLIKFKMLATVRDS